MQDVSGFKGDVRDDGYVKSPKARCVIAICARRIRDKRDSVDNEALRTGGSLSRMVYDLYKADATAERLERQPPD